MTIELYEPFNSKVWNVLKHCKDQLPDGQYPIIKTWVDCQKDGYVKVTYDDLGNGRLKYHLDNEKQSGISLGTFWHKARSAFSYGTLKDYDIVNCHPEIIYQLASKNGIECERLKDYCQNRMTYFDKYGKEFKYKVLIWINGGPLSMKTEFWDDLMDLYEEVNSIMKSLIKGTKEYKEALKLDSKDRHSAIRSIKARYIQNYENQLLMTMYNTCVDNKVKVSSLIYDGFMLYADTIPLDFDRTLEKAVKDKLDFDIKVIEKPIPEFKMSEWLSELVIDTDLEAVELFLSVYSNIIKSDGNIFVLKDNLWVRDTDYIKKLILNSKIKKRGAKANKPYAANVNGCENIFKALITNLDNTKNFVNKMNDSTLGYVFYKNGYYDLNKQTFFNDMKKTTLVRIERDYVKNNYSNDHPHIKDLYEKLFSCLGSEELIKYFCIAVARAIGGYTNDKVGYIMTGQRNSGKGTLNLCLDIVFENYVTVIPAPITKSQVSDVKAFSFLIDKSCDLARIAYSNEGISKDGKVTLDGNILKNMCSGGDPIPCRANFKDEVNIKNNTTLFISFNQIPKAEPADALATFKIFPFPYSYKADPNPKIKYERLGFDIKTYLKQTSYFINAFEWIIFNSFSKDPIHKYKTPECCEVEKDIIEDDNMVDFSTCFNKYLEIDEKAYVRASDLHYLFSQKLKISPVKSSKLMKEAGYPKKKKQIKHNRYWLYEGVKMKPNDDEDEINNVDEEHEDDF